MNVRPFRGWRPRPDSGNRVDGFLAPPYDILSADDKRVLLAESATNVVAVDLPHVPPYDAGPDETYHQAAELLRRWQEQGVLVQDDRPALYAYRQTYEWAGRSLARSALLCGVRATEFGQDVIPHEHTFPGPKADRLKLTEHTQCQLSPIFGFYRDPAGGVGEVLASAVAPAPTAEGELRGVREQLWTITDPGAIEAVRAALADEPAFIADGHHRYTTALNYCRTLRDAGRIDDEHEANFVLFALVAEDDPGLLILPTHRVVSGLAEDFDVETLKAASPGMAWRTAPRAALDPTDAGTALAKFGRGTIALLDGTSEHVHLGNLADPRAMAAIAPDRSQAWRALDVAVLHELILDRGLDRWRTDATAVDYTPDAGAAVSACRQGRGQLAAFLQPTDLAQVRAIALAGEVMPHKSTYFYPKLATGMVLKPLA